MHGIGIVQSGNTSSLFPRLKELGDELSTDLAARFLEQYHVRDEQTHGPGEGWRRHVVFGVKVLVDFAKHGRIERAFTEVEAIHITSPCRTHFVITNSIVRIDSTFDRRPFAGVRQNS